MSEALLQVEGLKLYYPVKLKSKSLFPHKAYNKAVDDISFELSQGETLGIVGESGCGKSTLGKVIVKLLKPTEGRLLYRGQDIFAFDQRQDMEFKKQVQMIFQDPYSSLDPRFTVERIITEPLVAQQMGNAKERRQRMYKLMEDVGLSPEYYNRYPHEFSGGQRQRLGIARALALNPNLLVCDEPVSALDVSIQAQILNLMKDLQDEYDLTYIFISHNLAVVKHICDRIIVMYLGHVVEEAATEQLFTATAHPYTKALLDAVPVPDPTVASMQETLEGDLPSPLNPPSGCCFNSRCKYATKRCREEQPQLIEQAPGHRVACHLMEVGGGRMEDG